MLENDASSSPADEMISAQVHKEEEQAIIGAFLLVLTHTEETEHRSNTTIEPRLVSKAFFSPSASPVASRYFSPVCGDFSQS